METSNKGNDRHIYLRAGHTQKANPKLMGMFNRSSVRTQFREKRLNKLNGASEYSLPNSQIKDLSQRSFSAMSRKSRKEQNGTVVSSIKGKLYCMKLGEINNRNIGFQGMFDDYYSLIYSDRVTEMLRKPLKAWKSRRSKIPIEVNSVILKSKNIQKPLSIFQRPKSKRGLFSGKIDSIIENCTDCLKIRSVTIG